MPRPKVYDPQPGYRYQLVARYGKEAYEHIDYAEDRKEMTRLTGEYRIAFGPEWRIKAILLPMKYWAS